ncbi:hypothetical protein DK419_01480 [Methylobacterium terrae]|uniref:Uncharacterized protein n=1 Tax=Methylobacterium terrae TaxID=2202827 RepID=A0A2U8WIS3_9HYPH|nr:hypothetical protein [Methylobacterium terrae]AWN45162.1 hypothetical protein DK419_01480 [Methylobacterium terrae]
MRQFLAVPAAIVLTVAAVPLLAAPVTRGCFLSVDGRVLVDRPCDVDAMADGSFTFNTADRGGQVDYVAFVSRTGPATAQASWNGERGATHADAPLGPVRREGACWVNTRTRLCVRP